ncbi:MAG: esterase-like activity of phytase family protein [Gammaproteobacteria bacterium]
MKIFFLIISIFFIENVLAAPIGQPVEMSKDYKTGDQFMGIRLLGTLNLSSVAVDGYAAHGLSGIAWDEDDQILYALSDKGYLLHLQPAFKKDQNNRIEILKNVDLITSYPLKNKHGKNLSGQKSDSEGLDILKGNNGIKGDAELIVSFEVKPRIHRYNPQGEKSGKYELPEHFNKIDDYQYKNAALESVIIHPKLGMLTAPQLALDNTPRHLRSIFDLKGSEWKFKPQHADDSSVTDLEISNDGSVLILERKYTNIIAPIQSIIREINLTKKGKILPTKTVALFESTKGWQIDNFEGLAHHKENKYFMISDDNKNIFQRTLLVYFELLN